MHMTDMRKKILFLVTEDWYFWSHRLPLAREAQRSGYSVIVATRVQEHGQRILAEGFKLISIRMLRRNNNPFKELYSLFELIRIYRNERPGIVHHVAVKPVVYGSLAARFARVPRVVNAIAGMGYVFSSDTVKAKLLRPFIRFLLKILLNRSNSRTIFQNPDDQTMLIQAGIVRSELTKLIRGSGVDPQVYAPSSEPGGLITVVLASRMLWDKGIKEFVEAAGLLRSERVKARFALVGDTDGDNPAAVPTAQLEAWSRSGDVEWWGKRVNMPEVFAASHIVCLPSAYGEGIPKVLIEAASCGRPIVTTDSPGCREIVRNNENGFLVPIRDPRALAHALRRLIEDSSLRKQMGVRGRELVLNEFTVGKVVEETLSLYDSLLL
jgi:glycosyltransferase involved in cell wall biosynthesis